MTMRLKPLVWSCLTALAMAACNDDGGVVLSGRTAAAYSKTGPFQLACVDHNRNWQCDDGDSRRIVGGSGDSQLEPAAGEFVLLEQRNSQNQRTQLLVSAKGSRLVNGISTLRAMLPAEKSGPLLESLAEQAGVAVDSPQLNRLLEDGFAAALLHHALPLAALAAYSDAVLASGKLAVSLPESRPTLSAPALLTEWEGSANQTDNRQLQAQGSLLLNNNESNRLYLFDASAETIQGREVDVIPAPESAGNVALQQLQQVAIGVLQAGLSLVVDTVSAASVNDRTPVEGGSPVVLQPGKGIAALQLTRDGQEAVLLMNSTSGKYTQSRCASAGSEGVFKIGLQAAAPYRTLAQSPACVHSGFTLLAADASGGRIAAWDDKAKRLWLLDGQTMQSEQQLAIRADTPQAIAISPGGRYVAMAGFGQAAIVDLQARRTLANFQGSWGNVSQLAFAGGLSQLLIIHGGKLHGIQLDPAMQWQGELSLALGEEIKGLAVSQDGDSYVLASDRQIQWRSVSAQQLLASQPLPSGMTVSRVALAKDAIVILGQNKTTSDPRYDYKYPPYQLYRSRLSLPRQPG